MPAKSMGLWAGTLSGLVVGGLITAVLDAATVPFSTLIGALGGGLVAAYVLYGKVGQAAISGALAAILGTPFFLGVSQIMLIFEVIPLPSGPNPSMQELQGAVAFIFLTSLVAGAAGGALMGALRHPAAELPPLSQTAAVGQPGAATPQVRYCVQCGAQIPAGVMICPHCNARQP